MPDPAIWLTEEDIRKCISHTDAIDALERTLKLEAKGAAVNVDKALATWGDSSSMHALGSVMPEAGYLGFKTWTSTRRGAAGLFTLFDAANGALLAVMEPATIGWMRTSAISGLATRVLAPPEVHEVTLIGTGSQAMMQVAALAATRRISRLRVFSPTPEKRREFVRRARESFAFEVLESSTLEEAVRGARIITLITRAREPFLFARLLTHGVHINAAGAILPANAEFAQDVFQRADLVVVDNLNNARKASRELIEHYGPDAEGWSEVRTLGELLLQERTRPPDADVTIFKSMGMGLSDLAVASTVYGRARERQIGRDLPRGAHTS